MMNRSALSYVMAGAALMALLVLVVAATVALSPAAAAATAADPGPAAGSRLGAPESPMAAFERMLGAHEPLAVAPDASSRVDPLLPHFQAALWSAPVARRDDRTARLHTVGGLR